MFLTAALSQAFPTNVAASSSARPSPGPTSAMPAAPATVRPAPTPVQPTPPPATPTRSTLRPPPPPAQAKLQNMLQQGASRVAEPPPSRKQPPLAQPTLRPLSMSPAAPAQPQQQQQQQAHQSYNAPAPAPPEQPPLAGENVMNVVMVGAECAPWSKTGKVNSH